MGLREANKERMKARLYESALALFRERGFKETRVTDIVEAAQVSEATFFNYFPTKQAVLDQSSLETKQYYGAYVQHLLARSDEPASDRLRELARVIASVFARDREFMSTVLNNTDLFFDSTGIGKQLDLDNSHLLADLFRQGQAQGEFDKRLDPVQLAEIYNATQLLTTLNWVNQWWGASKQKLEPRLLAAINVVLRGATP